MKYIAIIMALMISTPALAFSPETYADLKAKSATSVSKVSGDKYRVSVKNHDIHSGIKGADINHDFYLTSLKQGRDQYKDYYDSYVALIKDFEAL